MSQERQENLVRESTCPACGHHVAEVIIIPMQWRARDTMQEIEHARISYERVLIEHQGRLIDFHKDVHPY